MPYLTREAILAANDLPTEEVAVPEWGPGAVVLVRGMTGAERDVWEGSLTVERGGQTVQDVTNATAKAIVRCIVDENGNRVLNDRDANELGAKSAVALMRVWRVARRLSGIGAEAIEGKTADFTQASGSGSPSTSPNGSAKPELVS